MPDVSANQQEMKTTRKPAQLHIELPADYCHIMMCCVHDYSCKVSGSCSVYEDEVGAY